ncbi:MAG: 30S ribosome-binding factor RbfA [Acidobacteria bacterium]|nr:30S ribosome-binding factor RbfA [Acidobacteriota bacterium]
MVENRGREHHMGRLADAIRDEIGAILEGELADPRIGLATASEVHMAPDGRSAQVFITVAGNEHEIKETMRGLESAKGYIRHELADRLRLRHAPEIVFHIDRSEQYGARIEQLLARMKKRNKGA